jgi:hypothetical protein
MSRKRVREIRGKWLVTLEEFEGDPGLHDYGIPRMAWIRGARLLNRFGPDKALDLIDQRAERAADRGNYKAARRWRDLITAIHAIEAEERLIGDNLH